ncbi:MAG TPA: Ig-like domain-containing protein [Gemmatimonadaceae bacterium]|nr:Ig-like domain-containing protein [Gemmatimonadaceae bacterium]
MQRPAKAHVILAAVFGLIACGLTACGGGESVPSTQPTTSTPPPPPPPVPVVATVTVTGSAALDVGKTAQFSAVAKDSTGTAISGKTFTWSSANDAIASVASDGTVTGKTAGSTTISASVDGKSGSAAVTVNAPAPVVASISISGTSSLQAGTTTQLTATVKDASGAAITSVPVTWSSSDATLITVSNTGLVNAGHIANVTITATAGGKSATLAVTSSLTPYTFSFDPATSASDQQLIKDAVQFAAGFYQTTFGRTITTASTISTSTTSDGCSRGGSAAFTGAGAVTFCTSNAGWVLNGPISRQKITVHEVFHLWQFQYKWLGNPNTAGADWLIEGSAEFMGYDGMDAEKLIPIATTRGCMAKQVADFAKQQPPGLPSLPTLEPATVLQTTVGPVYPYSWIAVDELIASAGIGSLKVYADAIASGTPWQTAFQTAFGTSISAFYAQFPGYLASQPVPANFLCGV